MRRLIHQKSACSKLLVGRDKSGRLLILLISGSFGTSWGGVLFVNFYHL